MARSVISVALFLLGATFLLLQISTSECAERGANEQSMADLPSAPIVFNSPDELRSYLEELDKYFAIAGRPRYLPLPSTHWSMYNYLEYASDIFDIEDILRDCLEVLFISDNLRRMVQIGGVPSGYPDRFWPVR